MNYIFKLLHFLYIIFFNNVPVWKCINISPFCKHNYLFPGINIFCRVVPVNV